MKRLTSFILVVLMITMVGCGSEQPTKASGKVLNVLPDDLRKQVAEANPDVVTLDYLGNHADDYKKDELSIVVIVKGKVTHFGISKYGDYTVSLDNSKYSFVLHDKSANLVEGDEYIFVIKRCGGVLDKTILLNPAYYCSLSEEE